MSEEEKDAIDFFIHECEKYDGTIEIKGASVREETRILNTVVKFLKELNSLKKIEKSHQEENGNLRVEFEKVYEDNLTLAKELEQEKNKINTIKKIMSIGDVTDEALFTLVQTTMAELERLEGIEEKLDEEKEKNKALEEKQNRLAFKTNQYMNDVLTNNIISKDKIKNILDKFNKGDYHYIHDLMQEIQELLEEGINGSSIV